MLITLVVANSFAAHVVLVPGGHSQAQVTLISESRGETVLEFRMYEADVDTEAVADRVWSTVHVPGMAGTARNGWPEVPQISIWLETHAPGAQAIVEETDSIHRNWGSIRPAAEPSDRSQRFELRREPAPEFYSSNGIFPSHPVEISLSGGVSRSTVALVTFFPVQFNARSGEWTLHTRLRVRITHAGRSLLDQNVGLPRSTRDLLSRLLMTRRDHDDVDSYPPRLLLVTESQFLPALQPFIEWKTHSGIPVQTIIYSQVATSAPTLRTYIRNICDTLTPPPGYLLIVGDVDLIPTFYGVNNSLTDHPYSLLTDDDYLPDLSVGRIPSDSPEDCSVWVNRLLSYERDAVPPRNFKGTVVSSASALDPQHGIFVSNLFRAAGMDTVDQLQEPESATVYNLMNGLNSGRQWVFYIGHGYSLGWSSVAPDFTVTSQDQITAEAAPVVISVACLNADLDYPGQSFAEHWLTLHDNRGPVAFFGATEPTPFFYSDTLGIGALRAVFQQQCDRLGTAADLGRLATIQCFPQPPGGTTEETIQQFILLGDPSMRVFSALPESLSVNLPSTIPVHTQHLALVVQRGNHPAAAADVCLMSDSLRVYQVHPTDSLGQVNFPLRLANVGELQVTITAHNAVPVMRMIMVVPDTAFCLALGGVRVLDSSGDADGQADRSESCELQVRLANSGRLPTTQGVVRVSCNDPRVTVSHSLLSFPSIAPHDTVWLGRPLPITVSDSVNDQDVVMLRIVALPDQGDSSVFVYPLILHTPRPVFLSSSLHEDSGDGDGNPEAGERLDLRLLFQNLGTDRAASPVCSLRTSASGIHILSVQTNVASVGPTDTLMATALLRADRSVPRGYEFNYSYELTFANAPPLIGIGSQRIGQVPVFLYELDPMPQQIDAVEDALSSLGVEHERARSLPPDLSLYASVWIFCGIFPNTASLPQADAAAIAQYLDRGGNCYWEGGDVWVFDEPTVLHPYFHTRGVQDGSSDAGPVHGEAGTAFAHYHFEYAGENSFIDRLAPQDSARTVLRNVRPGAVYPLCVAYAGTTYHTVGTSIELGALADTTFPSTRVHLFNDVLSWFGIESRADISPPTIRVSNLSPVGRSVTSLPVFADVQDASGIQSVQLRYRLGEGMIQTNPMLSRRGGYKGVINGIFPGVTVFYGIRAADDSPAHNTITTHEYSLDVPTESGIALMENFTDVTVAELSARIITGEGCSWSLTNYPERVPVLELHAQSGQSVTYDTPIFDGSALQNPVLSFWHFLRETTERHRLLSRVVGSTDGGLTFPNPVYEYSQQGGGVLEAGTVQISALGWMKGQSNLVLRFEFFGDGYWRFRDIKVADVTAPHMAPVRDLVISVVPSGLQLSWRPVSGAKRYIVYGSVSVHFDGEYRELIRTRDTTFTDWDDTLPSRFYQVSAIMDDSKYPSAGELPNTLDGTMSLRPPDLKWNRKLQSASPK